MKKYIMLNEELDINGNNTIRYFQIGKFVDGKFTGLIFDYVGGGQYQEFYFVNDKITKGEDNEEMIDALDVSGITTYDECYDYISEIANEIIDNGTQEFIIKEDKVNDFDGRYFKGNDIENPIEVGLTYFK